MATFLFLTFLLLIFPLISLGLKYPSSFNEFEFQYVHPNLQRAGAFSVNPFIAKIKIVMDDYTNSTLPYLGEDFHLIFGGVMKCEEKIVNCEDNAPVVPLGYFRSDFKEIPLECLSTGLYERDFVPTGEFSYVGNALVGNIVVMFGGQTFRENDVYFYDVEDRCFVGKTASSFAKSYNENYITLKSPVVVFDPSDTSTAWALGGEVRRNGLAQMLLENNLLIEIDVEKMKIRKVRLYKNFFFVFLFLDLFIYIVFFP